MLKCDQNVDQIRITRILKTLYAYRFLKREYRKMIMILAFEVQNALPKLQFQTGKLDLELCACTSFSSEE